MPPWLAARRCHPDLAPHRWSHVALALADGLKLNAALDLAQIPA